ncbi:MAG: hypothetical protein JWO52_1382 [Gammaproteobacteria bacterium]|jgi:hypothetical protein|nr:hypothetical protein [Gammaproteobacteria bacterium]
MNATTLQPARAARGLSRKNSQRYAWLIYMKSDQIIPAVIPGSVGRRRLRDAVCARLDRSVHSVSTRFRQDGEPA